MIFSNPRPARMQCVRNSKKVINRKTVSHSLFRCDENRNTYHARSHAYLQHPVLRLQE